MRNVQRGWFGEERYFLVVPVDEDMARRREDVRGTTLQERNVFYFSVVGENRGGRTLRRPVLSANIVKNSSVEENVGKS